MHSWNSKSKLKSLVPNGNGNVLIKHADLGPVWVATVSYVLSWRYISDSRLLQERKCIHYSGGVTVEAGLGVGGLGARAHLVSELVLIIARLYNGVCGNDDLTALMDHVETVLMNQLMG